MKTDASIHFTTKGQDVKALFAKLKYYLDEHAEHFTFVQTTESNVISNNVVHHCFLPEKVVKEKGWSNDIYDCVLNAVANNKVCWFGVSDYGLDWDRRLMLENLKKVDGLAIFIGNISDGVKDEYDLAIDLGLDILLIR